MKAWLDYVLGYDSPLDAGLQTRLEDLAARLRRRHGLSSDQIALGVLDLKRLRLAMIGPDRLEYGASLAKVVILLAFFHCNPGAAIELPPQTRQELGLMIKASSNEMATKFSRQLGLGRIQQVLDFYGFYERSRGGGIWMGKHYGDNTERTGDPVGDHSHAVTVRQLLKFYLLLEQGRLVSPEASARMREIFASPQIPHDLIKFVEGLRKRPVELRRKWGTWEAWHHDSAVITGPGRHYILVGLTHHTEGDAFLAELAAAVDDLLSTPPPSPT